MHSNVNFLWISRPLCLSSTLGTHSMSMTLDSFCSLFSSKSPCLIVCWYWAFFVSGLHYMSAPN